ncbi:MAG: hypothetical protein HQM06_16845 [Magnetococcales bacterium]|nr:hypothetical protein [Magnetococcales bacterium]
MIEIYRVFSPKVPKVLTIKFEHLRASSEFTAGFAGICSSSPSNLSIFMHGGGVGVFSICGTFMGGDCFWLLLPKKIKASDRKIKPVQLVGDVPGQQMVFRDIAGCCGRYDV